MPPKKKDDASHKPPPLIGRMGTNLKIGILGLPNVGYGCYTLASIIKTVKLFNLHYFTNSSDSKTC